MPDRSRCSAESSDLGKACRARSMATVSRRSVSIVAGFFGFRSATLTMAKSAGRMGDGLERQQGRGIGFHRLTIPPVEECERIKVGQNRGSLPLDQLGAHGRVRRQELAVERLERRGIDGLVRLDSTFRGGHSNQSKPPSKQEREGWKPGLLQEPRGSLKYHVRSPIADSWIDFVQRPHFSSQLSRTVSSRRRTELSARVEPRGPTGQGRAASVMRRPALITPPCITARNRERSSRIAMSASTSPSTIRISASLPGSTVPNSCPRPMISAPVLVAQVMRFQRREADVLDEERQFLGVVAVRVPGEAVVAPHAEPAAGFQDHPGAFGSAFERLLVSVDDRLGHAKVGALLDARQLELQRRDDGRVPLEQHVEGFLVHEGAVFEACRSRPEARS